MNRTQKEQVVEELGHIFSNSGVVLVAHYNGLTVSEISELRNLMRESNCGVRVAKNRLSKIALEGKANAKLSEFLKGQTVLLFSEDPVAAAKISVKFSETNENLKLIGGIMDNEVLDSSGVQNVASLPTLDEARANIVGILNASASKLISILLAHSEKMSSLSAENSETQPKE